MVDDGEVPEEGLPGEDVLKLCRCRPKDIGDVGLASEESPPFSEDRSGPSDIGNVGFRERFFELGCSFDCISYRAVGCVEGRQGNLLRAAQDRPHWL